MSRAGRRPGAARGARRRRGAPAPRFEFASDNTAGMCPEALAALSRANAGWCASYGEDPHTARAADLLRGVFGTPCDVYFVFNGTAANSLALAAMCQSYHSVIAHAEAHIEADECGAPEFFSNGTKLLTVPGPRGKLEPGAVEAVIVRRTDIHYPKPRVLSLTQPTEHGTLYTVEQTAALARLARAHGLKVHVDGARFANAVAALGVAPADLTWRAGVDVLCFGGAKMGMGVGEAVVFFDRAVADEFAWRCKQAGQLAAKMRFLAAPWVALLEGGAWLAHARHANACARALGEALAAVPGVSLLDPVEANAVFAAMPERYHEGLRVRGWQYYRFIGGGARFMCSWATREAHIEALAADLGAIASEAG